MCGTTTTLEMLGTAPSFGYIKVYNTTLTEATQPNCPAPNKLGLQLAQIRFCSWAINSIDFVYSSSSMNLPQLTLVRHRSGLAGVYVSQLDIAALLVPSQPDCWTGCSL